MDVGEWLRGLSLGEYEEKFRDHKIDGKVLASLTADDLRDIGVSSVGDRRRLLDAISLLAGARPLTDRPASRLQSAPDKGRQISAERPVSTRKIGTISSAPTSKKHRQRWPVWAAMC